MDAETKKKLLNIAEDSVVITTFSGKFKEKNLDDIVFFKDRVEHKTKEKKASEVTGFKRVAGNVQGFGFNVIDRLAKDAVSKPLVTLKFTQTDPDLGGEKRLNISATDFTTDDDNIKAFRFGKDVRHVNHFFRETLSPFVSLGNDDSFFNEKEEISHIYQTVNFGQNSLFKTFDRIKQKNIPYTDHDGVFTPKDFLTKPELVFKNPHLYNSEKNLDQFRDPDNESTDGAYDVLGYRSTKINTSFSDIQLKGTRGLFGVGDWNMSSHNIHAPKGSSVLSNRINFRQSRPDFFDDAQDVLFSDIPVVTASFRPGYISDFTVKNTPFIDIKHYFESDSYYSHLSDVLGRTSKEIIMSSSLKNFKETGTRYRVATSGFINTPFFSNIEKVVNGTDSLSFSGLLRE